jgi:putative addiction module component (TIGR02574 family)
MAPYPVIKFKAIGVLHMTKEAVLEQAKELSKHDQIELVFDLWDLVDGNEIPTIVSPELAAELDRRREADLADKTPPEDWDVLRAQLLRGEI